MGVTCGLGERGLRSIGDPIYVTSDEPDKDTVPLRLAFRCQSPFWRPWGAGTEKPPGLRSRPGGLKVSGRRLAGALPGVGSAAHYDEVVDLGALLLALGVAGETHGKGGVVACS